MKHIILLFACVYLAFSVNLSAQNVAGSVEVGVYSAYQFTHFSGGYIENWSGRFENNTYSSYGMTLGALAEIHISRIFSIVALLRYEELHGKSIRDGDKYPVKLPDGTEHTMTQTYEFEIITPQVASTFLGKFIYPRTNLSLLTGISLGILTNDNEVQRLILSSDSNVMKLLTRNTPIPPNYGVRGFTPMYSDESASIINQYTGPIHQRKSLQLGLTAGLQYDLPIYTLDEAAQKFVTITPSVLFNYNLTTYSDYEKLRAWNVSAGFVLKVGL
jgi:hypothetical protein